MTLRPLCGLFLTLAACGHSSGPEVYGAATIGPEGGELAVDSGPQSGLLLSVPPGALAAPTELRIVASGPAVPERMALQYEAPLASAFEIQPIGVELAVPASLRAPYRIDWRETRPPGGVRLRRLLAASFVDIDPTAVDVVTGSAEAPVRSLGRYQIVRGPGRVIAPDPGLIGTSAALTDGFTFKVEAIEPPSPFAAPPLPGVPAPMRWRITGPGVDDSLIFAGERLLGRESAIEDWSEIWSEPYAAWTYTGATALPAPGVTQPTSVQSPIGGAALAGQITVWSAWTFAAPRQVGERLLCEVVQLHVLLAWQRSDLGVGQRDLVFWFAPEVGLVAFTQDGVEHTRPNL